MKDNKYITPGYETISEKEKNRLSELCQSSIINGFTKDDFERVLSVFREVVGRLIEK